jgi:NADP-dependent 3-hydroxy acid dehydrogenase YdfG
MGCLATDPYGRKESNDPTYESETRMTKIMAIFGAGPGFGLSVAQRFGREGYELALVARNEQRLNEHVRTLGEKGIKAQAFSDDLADQTNATTKSEALSRRSNLAKKYETLLARDRMRRS